MTRAERRTAESLLRLRLGQLIVNERYKRGDFKIPIHLALGHEAIAVAVDAAMGKDDKLVLSHRNVHYNLARTNGLRAELAEYYLQEDGLACGKSGSMNLANPGRNVLYTSSILGNNLAVGSGIALAERVSARDSVVFIVTGDGAMEEGSFYESLLLQRSNGLSVVTIIENNQWSLGSMIEERRAAIDVGKMAESLGASYTYLTGNDTFEYVAALSRIRDLAARQQTSVCVEVGLTTLGHRIMKTEDRPEGKFINYHAGAAPTMHLEHGPVIVESDEDPIHVLKEAVGARSFDGCVKKTMAFLNGEIT